MARKVPSDLLLQGFVLKHEIYLQYNACRHLVKLSGKQVTETKATAIATLEMETCPGGFEGVVAPLCNPLTLRPE